MRRGDAVLDGRPRDAAAATAGATSRLKTLGITYSGPSSSSADHGGDRVAGRDLHPLRDPTRADVERAAEDTREREHVVDLVRVVGAPGRDDRDAARRVASGAISGVGFAIANTIASSAIVAIPAALTRRRGPRDRGRRRRRRGSSSASPVTPSGFVRSANAALTGLRSSRPRWIAPVLVAADHRSVRPPRAGCRSRRCRPRRRPSVTIATSSSLLPTTLSALSERGEHDDRGPVLVVVEDRDVERRPAGAARSRSSAARRCPRG